MDHATCSREGDGDDEGVEDVPNVVKVEPGSIAQTRLPYTYQFQFDHPLSTRQLDSVQSLLRHLFDSRTVTLREIANAVQTRAEHLHDIGQMPEPAMDRCIAAAHDIAALRDR